MNIIKIGNKEIGAKKANSMGINYNSSNATDIIDFLLNLEKKSSIKQIIKSESIFI